MEGSITVVVKAKPIYSFDFVTNLILLLNGGLLLKLSQFVSVLDIRPLVGWSNLYHMDDYRLLVFAVSTAVQCIYFYFLTLMQ